MKRSVRYTLLFLPAAVLLILFMTLAWLFGTTDGARWLIQSVSRSTEMTFRAESLEGSLLHQLRLTGISVSWPERTAQVQELRLRWDPLALLAGRVSLHELTAAGVVIQDRSPETQKKPDTPPPADQAPGRSGLPAWIRFRVETLSISDIAYQRQGRNPIVIDRLAGKLTLSRGAVSVRKLLLAMELFRLEGNVDLGFVKPFVETDATITPAAPIGGMDRFAVRASLRAADTAAPEATGSLELEGLRAGRKVVALKTGLGVTENSVQLTDFHMSAPGRGGNLQGNARLALTPDDPEIQVELALSSLDLSPQFPAISRLNGSFRVHGTQNRYQGSLSLSQEAQGLRSVNIKAAFRGSGEEIALTSITGRWLGGTVQGSARADWQKTMYAEASLRVRSIDPGLARPEWHGNINADLNGTIRLPKKGARRGTVFLQLLKSRLQGRPLTGELHSRVDGGRVLLDRLLLRGKGFDLEARGDLTKRTDITIHVSDLSVLRKETKGGLTLEGWVRRREKAFSGSLDARGKDLIISGMKAGSIHVSGNLGDGEYDAFTFSASVLNAVYKGIRAETVHLEGSGTMRDHQLSAVMQSEGYAMQARIAGAYADGRWQGRIVDLSGTEPERKWSAQHEASLVVSAHAFSLSPLVIAGSGGERLELSGRIGRNPLSGSVAAEWHQVDISRANPWLTGIRVSGLSNGRISGKVLSEERFQIFADVSLNNGDVGRRVLQADLKAKIKEARLSLIWQDQRLEGTLAMVLQEYGRLDAGMSLPLPAQLPIALKHDDPFQGFVKGQLRETGLVSFLFPSMIQESHGRIDVDVSAGGTWKLPVVSGSLLLTNAGAYFPAAGIRVSDIRLQAGIERNRVSIESFSAKSGPGNISGKAVITLEGWNIAGFEGHLRGERFQVLLMPQMQMLVNPKLEFNGTREKITARGEIRVPELLVYGPPAEDKSVQPSEDVVIAGSSRTEADKNENGRPVMDVNVKIILGERVIVKAEGVDAQLGGQVVLIARPFEDAAARGEIRVIKGKYGVYGVSLEIKRGRIIFGGDAIGNPLLDILAVREVENIEAGVTVTGNLKKPAVKLYSQPTMADADILAYIILGHPLGQDREQGTYLMQAAAALLSAGQSVALQDQIRQRLGLDVIDIQAGGDDVSRSLITIGKYLSSRLYISYGIALFTGENTLRLRYRFAKRWELESRSGETSGVDLFYTIRFD